MDNSTVPAKRTALIFYFGLAFAISWNAWLPAALASYNQPAGYAPTQTALQLLGVFGPFLSAIITSILFDGRSGVKSLFGRFLILKVPAISYLFALFVPVLLALSITLLHTALGSPWPDFANPPFLHSYPLPAEAKDSIPLLGFLPFVFLQQMLLGSSMGEEPGWRGYALPRMQTNGALRASMLLGFLWALWHLPLWLAKGSHIPPAQLPWEFIRAMATTVLFTWLFNRSRGSLFLALLFHTSIAITGLFLAQSDGPAWLSALVHALAAALLVLTGRSLNLAGSSTARQPDSTV